MSLASRNHRSSFQKLTQLLLTYQTIWRESPFTNDELSWSQEYPELFRSVLNWRDGELEQMSDEGELLKFLTPHLPALEQVGELRLTGPERRAWRAPPRAVFGLPRRKLKQAEGFVSSALPLIKTSPNVVDWCSGRGYLARLLYYAGFSQVVCLEKDSGLCRDGQASHQRMDAALGEGVVFRVQDVLKTVESCFDQDQLHTALHACGELHMSMLRQGVAFRVSAVACSPCCYHLIAEEQYVGLSVAAQASGLALDRKELKLATAELCTANSMERSLRRTELLWRIAFDLRSREVRGRDCYQPTPSVKKSVLKGSFREYTDFMLSKLEKKGRRLDNFGPLNTEREEQLLAQAGKKLSRILRLEKARLGFRKALEYWLLLDRVLFLEDNGYQVQLKEFCKKTESARNIVILATYAA